MKILFKALNLTPEMGGLQSRSRFMIQELQKNNQLDVVYLGPRTESHKFGNVNYFSGNSEALLNYFTLELIKKNKYDLIYVADIRKAGFILYKSFLKEKNTKIIASVASLHSYSDGICGEEYFSKADEEKLLLPELLKQNEIDYVHVPCIAAKKLFKKMYPGNLDFIVSPMGLPENLINQNNVKKVNQVLVASRNQPRKNLELLSALGKAAENKLKIKVCGAGVDKKFGRIHYLGPLPQEDVFSIMKKSSFIMSLSVHEIFANSLTEGTCFGAIPIYPLEDPVQKDIFQEVGKGFSLSKISLTKNLFNAAKSNDFIRTKTFALKNFNLTKNIEKILI